MSSSVPRQHDYRFLALASRQLSSQQPGDKLLLATGQTSNGICLRLFFKHQVGLVGAIGQGHDMLWLGPEAIFNVLRPQENAAALLQRLGGYQRLPSKLVLAFRDGKLFIGPPLDGAGGPRRWLDIEDILEARENAVATKHNYRAQLQKFTNFCGTAYHAHHALAQSLNERIQQMYRVNIHTPNLVSWVDPRKHLAFTAEHLRALNAFLLREPDDKALIKVLPDHAKDFGYQIGSLYKVFGIGSDFSGRGGQQGQAGGFAETLKKNNLTETYNNSNPEHPANDEGVQDIGGVGIQTGMIEGLKDSLFDVLEDEHLFIMPEAGEKPPFSDDELRQLLRELAVNIFYHGRRPIFSLHFNANGTMYPVIPPEYANTLVGRVMGMLDYMMKGYLNGSIYEESYVEQWAPQADLNSQAERTALVDLDFYCRSTIDRNFAYHTVYDLLNAVNLPQTDTAMGKMPYHSTFRIIADNPIVQTDNIFQIGSDFRVEYTIETTPEYDSYLEKYQKTHGHQPPEYKALHEAYACIAEDIRTKMPKLPMCKAYFAMLGTIHFFSYYFATLKDMGKVVLFPPHKPIFKRTFPRLLPSLPIRKRELEIVNVSVEAWINHIAPPDKQKLIALLQAIIEETDIDDQGHLVLSDKLWQPDPTLNNHLLNAALPLARSIANGRIVWKHAEEMPTAEVNASVRSLVCTLVGQLIVSKLTLSKKPLLESAEQAQLTGFGQALVEAVLNSRKELAENLQKQIETLRQNSKREIARLCARGKAKQLEDNTYLWGWWKPTQEWTAQLNNHWALQQQSAMAAEEKRLKQAEQEMPNQLQKNYDSLFANPLGAAAGMQNIGFPLMTLKDESGAVVNKFRIVGGCGLRVQTCFPQSLPSGEAVIQATLPVLAKALPETQTSTMLGGKQHWIFKLPLHNYLGALASDYAWLEDSRQTAPTVASSDAKLLATLITLVGQSNDTKRLDDLLVEQPREAVLAALSHQERNGFTALLIAAQRGQAEVLDWLIQRGANPLITDEHGFTVLHLAAQSGNEACVAKVLALPQANQLIRAGAPNGVQPLHVAVQHQHLGVTKMLLKHKASVNTRLTDGSTALLSAALGGHAEIVAELIAAGADIETSLDNGATALHLAAAGGHHQALAVLVKACVSRGDGSDILLNRGRHRDGMTALHLAAKGGHVDACKVLLEGDAAKLVYASPVLDSGVTPLHLIAKYNKYLCADILISAKASTSTLAWEDETPLVTAIRHFNETLARYFVHCTDSDTQYISKNGRNIIEIAAECGMQVLIDDIVIEFTKCKNTAEPKPTAVDLATQKHGRSNIAHWLCRIGNSPLLKSAVNSGWLAKELFDFTDEWQRLPFEVALAFGQETPLYFIVENQLPYPAWWSKPTKRAQAAAEFGLLTTLIYVRGAGLNLDLETDEEGKVIEGERRPVYLAARHGQLRCLNELILQGCRLDYEVNGQMFHVFQAALQSRDKECVQVVGRNLPKIPAVFADGSTSYDIVASTGDIPNYQQLPRLGLPLTTAIACKALDIAIVKGHCAFVQELLKANEAPRPTSADIMKAMTYGQEEMLDLLLECTENWDEPDSDGVTPLLHAAALGNLTQLRRFLAMGARLQPSATGHSVFTYAAKAAQENSLLELLELPNASAMLEHKAPGGKTVLEIAWEAGLAHAVTILIKLDASAATKTMLRTKHKHFTPTLCAALLNGEEKTLGELVEIALNAVATQDIDDWQQAMRVCPPTLNIPLQVKSEFLSIPFVHLLVGFAPEKNLSEMFQWYLDTYGEEAMLVKDARGNCIWHVLARASRSLSKFSKGLEQTNSLNHTALMYAVAVGNQAFIQMALTPSNTWANTLWGLGNLSPSKLVEPVDFNGNTILHHVAQAEQDEHTILTMLLPHVSAAQINAPNHKGITPLMTAAFKGHIGIVSVLLAANATIKSTDHDGRTALHFAAAGGHFTMVRELIKFGANPLDIDHEGNAPLHLAAQHDDVLLLPPLKDIMSWPADLHNAKDLTPLHIAVLHNKNRMVEILANTTDWPDGVKPAGVPADTPLLMAAALGNLPNVIKLARNGGQIDRKTPSGANVYQLAAEAGNLPMLTSFEQFDFTKSLRCRVDAMERAVRVDAPEIVEKFLQDKVDVNVPMAGGTAFTLACKLGSAKVARLLYTHGAKIAQRETGGPSPNPSGCRQQSSQYS